MSVKTNKGLGKGFGSLLPQDFDQSILLDKNDRIQKVALDKIEADPNQPRRTFDQNLLNELAQSINQYGILQPIVATKQNDTFYIVAGERRFRAAKIAGLKTVPVLVKSLEELERLEISLVENVQRVDLSPLEQAVSIARLHEQFNMEYAAIAERLGKANSTIVNIVRLLQLPEFAQESLKSGTISEGHARQVLALKDVEHQHELVTKIEHNKWSVRQAEQFVSDKKADAGSEKPYQKPKPQLVSQKTTKSLGTKYGCKVAVSSKAKGGKVTLDFADQTTLDKFIKWLETSKV